MAGGAWTPYTTGNVVLKVTPNPATSILVSADTIKGCISIRWVDPDTDKIDSDTGLTIKWAKSVLVRKQGSAPNSIDDGTTLISSPTKDQYRYTPYDDYDITRGVTYYYAVFTVSESGVPSSTAPTDDAMLEKLRIGPTKNLDGVQDIDAGTVTFTWQDPDDEPDRDRWAYTELRYYETDSIVGLQPTGGTLLTTSREKNQYRYSGFTSDAFKRETWYKIVAWAYGESGRPSEDTGRIYSLFLENATTGSVTTLSAAPMTDYVSLTWNDPDDSQWDHTIVRRKEGSAPQSETDGDLVLTSYERDKYRYSTSAYHDTYPANHRGTTFHYAAFAVSINGEVSPPARASAVIALRETGPVVTFTASESNMKVILKWQDPVDTSEKKWGRTVIVRNTSRYPSNPSDGIVVITSSLRDQYRYSGYTDSAVSPGETFYYTAFTYSIDDVLCDEKKTASVAMNLRETGPVVSFTASERLSGGRFYVALSWQDPSDSYWDRTVIVRRTDRYPNTPSDGTVIITSSTKNQYQYSAYMDENAIDINTTYYYSAFTYSVDDVLCDEKKTATVSISAPALSPTTNMRCIANPSRGGIEIRWTDPDENAYSHTVLRRSTTGYPKSPSDGSFVTQTSYRNQYQNTSYVDTNVSTGSTYYYTAFAYSTYDTPADSGAQGSALYYEYRTMTMRFDSKDPSLPFEYFDDAVSMRAGDTDAWMEFFGCRPCIVKDGKVLAYLNPDDYTKIEDGSSSAALGGEYMIEFPARGVRFAWLPGDPNYNVELSVTNDPTTGDNRHKWDMFDYKGERRDAIYISAYLLDSNGDSKPSRTPKTYSFGIDTSEDIFTVSSSFGEDSDVMYYGHWTYLTLLFMLMYGCQVPSYASLGNIVNQPTGYADKSGLCAVTSGKGVKLFGLESYLSTVSTLVGGIDWAANGAIGGNFSVQETIGSGFVDRIPGYAGTEGYVNGVYTGSDAARFTPNDDRGSTSTYFKSYCRLMNSGNIIAVGTNDYKGNAISPVSVSEDGTPDGNCCRAVCYCI